MLKNYWISLHGTLKKLEIIEIQRKFSKDLTFLQKVRHIKEVSSNANFSFQLEAIMELNTNKATSGDIHVLLTSRTKSTILSEEFFDKLRIADVTFSYYKNIS